MNIFEVSPWHALRVKRLSNLDQLDAIHVAWDTVYEASNAKSPFQSFQFVKTWYQHFSQPNQVRLYLVTDGVQPIGFLPLKMTRKSNMKILSSLTNDHCFHSGPLVKAGYEEVFREAVLRGLIMERQTWDALLYRFCYSFSDYASIFSSDLLRRNGVSYQYRIEPTYTVALKPVEVYFGKDLKKRVRDNIKRHQKLLDKSGDWTLRHHRNKDAINVWGEFLRMEDSGWKGRKGSSIARTNLNYQMYYKALLAILADTGGLSIFFLELNGSPIAGVFGYVENSTFHYAKIAYDEKYRIYSPSNLLFIMVLKYIDNNYKNIKRIHMFPWDYGYKHRFINEESYASHLLLFSKSIRGRCLALFWTLKKKLSLNRNSN